jgi:hypothetical protein
MFFLDATEKAGSAVYIEDSFYHYRFNQNSVANGYRPGSDIEHRQFMRLNLKMLNVRN